MNFESWRAADLDLVRSLLTALSWPDEDTVVPVSVTSIHHEIVRRNREFSTADALTHLARIGDAQRLDHGFWLPCPTHAASDGDIVVVVSSEPTEALISSHGPAVRQGEYGRYFPALAQVEGKISSVPIAQWLGAPSSSTNWIKGYLDDAPFSPPIGFEGVEVYRHWKSAATRRWLPRDAALHSGQDHVLARMRAGRGYVYQVLRITGNLVRAFHELPAGFDIPRVMCAFQRLADDPLPVTVKPSRSGGTLSISSPLVPEAERVFLHCVGSVRIRSSPTKIEADLPIQAQPDIRRLFSALGCDIQELPE